MVPMTITSPKAFTARSWYSKPIAGIFADTDASAAAISMTAVEPTVPVA